MNLNSSIIKCIRWTVLSGISGVLSGISAAIFLITLQWATNTREQYPILIWLLPIAGAFIGWLYLQYGKDVASGNNLIIDEIHNLKNTIPIRMAPLVLIGTLATHLFGGSAGREGTAVQMGASLSDQLSHIFKIEKEERKILLAAGAGSGFAAAIGAPWAGIIFGMEVINIGNLKLFAWFQCLVASFVAYTVAVRLGAPHSHFSSPEITSIAFVTCGWVALSGIVFGLAARIFAYMTHKTEKCISRCISYPPMKPFIGGIILVSLFWLEGSYRYVGLGIPFIQTAFHEVASFQDPLLKSIFTSITIGSGFKGGEFVPLVFIGTTLGSALSSIIPISLPLLAALGFAAVFGGAANTPIACSIMAMEIFGYRIGVYAIISCFMSYYVSGHHGIYKSQRVHMKKQEKLLWLLGYLGQLPKRFLSKKKY